MDTVTYPDEATAKAINEHFVAVKLVSKDNIDVARKLQVKWLPSLVVTDPLERIHHSWVGFLPPKWFAMELLFGRAQAAFGTKDFAKAIQLYDRVVAEFPQAERAPEALYWKAISTYRQTNDFADAGGIFKDLVAKHPNSIWARKVEVFLS